MLRIPPDHLFGHAVCCRRCRHRIAGLESHPNPCGYLRWDGCFRLEPSIRMSATGKARCSAFEPADAVPDGFTGPFSEDVPDRRRGRRKRT